MNDEKNKKIISPITFCDSCGDVSAIVEKAISFIARQQTKTGAYETFETDDESLANLYIPYGVKPEEYSLLLGGIRTNGIQVEKGKIEVCIKGIDMVRPAQSEKVKDVIANYEIFPIEKRIHLNRKGEVQIDQNDVDIRISIKTDDGITNQRITILYTKIANVVQIISKMFPTAIIFDKRNAYKIENDLRGKMSKIRETKVYIDAGWQEIDNVKVYLHKSCKLQNGRIKTELNLPCDERFQVKDLYNIWRSALNMFCYDDIAAILCGYSLLGVSYKVFDEAGFPPHFLLFISGKTGSFKTAISKILYMQLVDDEHREFPRRIDADTVTSFERALVESGRDTITLYDDYAPAKTVQDKRMLDSKLEVIIRMVGDGSTKSRSNVALEDRKGDGVKGAVVLTGELRGKGLSSNLRCLYCELDKECIQIENLSWFQTNRNAYTTLIQHFAFYLSRKWNYWVLYIREEFDKKRTKARKYLKAGRLVDTLVTMWLLMDMMESFLVEYCAQNKDVTAFEMDNLRAKEIDKVMQSELLSNEEDPATIFMKALATMMENKKINLVEKNTLTGASISMIDGCMDDNYIYLLPDVIYMKVVGWLRCGGITFSLDMHQLGALLCQEGYAESAPNGTNKRTYYARLSIGTGNKIKFLKIPKVVMEKIMEER